MSTSDQIAIAKFEQQDIREAMDLAMADERWRDVAKYATQLAEITEKLTRLAWANENRSCRYSVLSRS